MTGARLRRRRNSAIVLGMIMILAACGSTAPRDAASPTGTGELSDRSLEATGSRGELEGADPLGDTPGDVGGSAARDGGEAGGGLDGSTGSPGAVDVPGAGSQMGDPRSLAMGHGVTTDKIELGIAWVDLNAYFTLVNAAFGTDADNPSSATTKEWAELVVRYQNEQGGILGRKLEPIYYEIQTQDLVTAEGRRRAEQQMCATFTEDHRVFSFIPLESNEGVILQCAKRADTPVVMTANTDENLDRERFAEVGPWWYRPNWLSSERREEAMVARLVAQRWFGNDAKVGIMVEDKPAYRRAVNKGLKPALARAGVEVVSEIAWPDQVESPWATYVLQMRNAGVTHVIWSGCGCSAIPPGLTMREAENQRWRARHALGTEYLLRGMPTIAPHEQLEGMGGIGWGPEFDIGPERAAAEEPITPADALCRNIMRDGDIPVHGNQYCEFIFFVRDVLARAPALTRAGFTAGVERLSGAFVSAMTPATRLGPGRHDGTSAVWDVAFDKGCECVKYSSGPHAVE